MKDTRQRGGGEASSGGGVERGCRPRARVREGGATPQRAGGRADGAAARTPRLLLLLSSSKLGHVWVEGQHLSVQRLPNLLRIHAPSVLLGRVEALHGRRRRVKGGCGEVGGWACE